MRFREGLEIGKGLICSLLGNFFTLENFGLLRAQNQTPFGSNRILLGSEMVGLVLSLKFPMFLTN